MENWQEFVYTENEKSILVKWHKKDFVASYDLGVQKLQYGLHIMYMCPKVYSEEMLREDYCPDIIKRFEQAEKFLENNPDFATNLKTIFDEKNKDNDEQLKKLYEERLIKRKQFKNNEISQKEWTIFCKEFNKIKDQVYFDKRDFVWDYIEKKTEGKGDIKNIIRDYVLSELNI